MSHSLMRLRHFVRQQPQYLSAPIIVWMLMFSSLCGALEADDAPKTAYKLGPGDRILIKVYGEEDLSVSLVLAETGSFTYPFLGKIRAQGLSVAELQELITTGLKGPYLRNPEVTVLIEEFRPFYLNGEVARPGGYPYRPGLTLNQAITLAGGLTERASRNKIKVLRPGSDDDKKRKIKLEEPVYPGDIITVERGFF